MNKMLDYGYSEAVSVVSRPKSKPPASAYFDQNEIREAARKVWRRKRLIAGVAGILTVMSALIVLQIHPLYKAAAMIMVDPRDTRVVDVEAVVGSAARDTEQVLSEVEVVTSRQLISKLVDKLDLLRNPEFNLTLKPRSFLSVVNPFQLIPKEWVRGSKSKLMLTPEEQQAKERSDTIDNIIRGLTVTPKARARVIAIEFKSEDPEVSAKVVNTLADLYLVDQLEEKFEATERAAAWLNERLTELRKKVQDADNAVAAYRASANLIDSFRAGSGVFAGKDGVTLVQQQISDLTTQLTVARADRAAADSKLKQVKEVVAAGANGEESVAEVLNSPLIQHLREQESDIQQSIADLNQQYGERHPKIIAAHAQLEDIRNKIGIETRKIMRALEDADTVARTRESTIAAQLEELKKQVIVSDASEVKLHELEMEAETNRTLMETFMSRFKETSAEQKGGIQTADARIISRADVPGQPWFPKWIIILPIIVFFSTILGVAVAFVAEHLDHGFRSGVQFEQETGVPVLALIPLLAENLRPADYLVQRMMSAFAESVRNVYTSILLGQGERPIKRLVITSAQPSEGKSTLALSLARMFAISGQKTLLVEADLRRPSIHHHLGKERSVGLAEVLIGAKGLEEALYRDTMSDATILLAGKDIVNPAKLISSHQMESFLEEQSKHYDIVIVDTAPVLAVSDALLLANRADATIFACRWASTARETASLGLKELREANASIIGAVISAVDMNKSRTYGYADTAYYYYAKKYYGE